MPRTETDSNWAQASRKRRNKYALRYGYVPGCDCADWRCGHLGGMHGDGGKGRCEGWLTALDTGDYEGPCQCQEFLPAPQRGQW